MTGKMRPLSEFSPDVLSAVTVILCDIDDTLTHDGVLPAEAYGALEALNDAGLICVPITGRPAGWCDHIARMWPVDGVVGENGAFYFHYDQDEPVMVRVYSQSGEERDRNRKTLKALGERILREVPGAQIASDQAYREIDLAIDFCEDVPRLADDQIVKIKAMFEAAGAVAKISSIHVNGWFGDHDKLTMTKRFLADIVEIDAAKEAETIVFLGDSPNDAPMFGYFPNAVGVANVRDLQDHMEALPAFVTEQRGGFGFAEFADRLLAAKQR